MKQSYTFALGLLALLTAPAVHAQVVSGTPKLEAEDAAVATLSGGAVVATTITGSSGAGYVDYNGPSSGAAFKFNAAAAGLYDLVIRYESQYDFKLGDLVVNGGTRSEVYFNSTKTGAAFRSTTPRRILLKMGANIVSIQGNYNYYGIDYIQLAPSAAAPAAQTPAASTGRIEAELGQLFATQAFARDGDASPRSGATYVGLFSDVKSANSSITLPITVATAGLYQIAVGARNQPEQGDKQFDLAVTSGTGTTGKLTIMLGATAPDFKSYTVGKFDLTAGTNTIVITTQTAYIDIDYADITATTGSATPTANRASAEAQKALAVFPNPSNGGVLNVRLEATTARTARVELVNSLGQRVLSTDRSLKIGVNQFAIGTEHVAAGIYQLVVRSGDTPVLSRRVVVAQ